MTYEFAKYPDGTVGVFSNISKKENGEEFICITFERPTENGFDTYAIELPSYNVVLEDGKYSEKEKKTFFEIVKNGSAFFFKYARLRGLKISQDIKEILNEVKKMRKHPEKYKKFNSVKELMKDLQSEE